MFFLALFQSLSICFSFKSCHFIFLSSTMFSISLNLLINLLLAFLIILSGSLDKCLHKLINVKKTSPSSSSILSSFFEFIADFNSLNSSSNFIKTLSWFGQSKLRDDTFFWIFIDLNIDGIFFSIPSKIFLNLILLI